MDKQHLRILRVVSDATAPCVFTGADARAAAELCDGGFVTASVRRASNGAVMETGVTGITMKGRDALDESRGRVGRWFLKRLDTIVTATITAVIISVVTNFVMKAIER